MKRVLRRSWLTFIVVIAFLGGMVFLVAETLLNASDWVDQAYNGHISGAGGLAQAGSITDRNGEILAQTVDKKRVYHEDKAVRKALLHVVGDNSLNISTAVQSQFRSQLTGYSFIWGLNMPKSFRSGRDMRLTVDAKTCKAAYNALKNYDSGACVVYNYNTGEILCSVSVKSYDPNSPPKINKDNEKEYDGVYLDNVLSSTYTPGSIFKIVTAAAAIENIPGVMDRQFHCSGEEEIGGGDITCVGSHGTVDLEEAFGHSCNIVFAELAVELGPEKMNAMARKMGIDAEFSVSGVKTKKGSYDIKNINKNQLAWSGVGQYTDQVNPTHMAILCGAIARGGQYINPYIINGDSGSLLKDLGLSGTGSTGEQLIKPSTAKTIGDLMRKAVINDYGDDMFGGMTVCAKTGTGETVKGDEEKNDGWMIGYCTDKETPLAFACVVHGTGEYGYSSAGKVAKAAMIQAKKSLTKE
ncbi:MAG: penicillin-binding transpeptidase domain-containing protein [Ruminococcus sp.]|jgi:peptidoglycan glycosyltransferase|nr:penicillin-binding transpeptidase domain-containing protein [Ruminococcus sp.]